MRADVLICGAGITGLTIARELLIRGVENVVVMDKEDAPGRHASGRNSGVLHAGLYYAPDSLRAKTCLEGARRMKDYCLEKGLPLLEAGKVVVARREEELPELLRLRERAAANGAVVRLVDEKELAEIEPFARTRDKALFSPNTAMVDPKAVLESLRRGVAATGKAVFLMNAPFRGRFADDAVAAGKEIVSFRLFINAAGAHADTVAAAFGAGRGLAAIPFKGIYRKLRPEKAHMVRGNIYPTPDPATPFLGVHFTRSVHGDVYLGPTAIPALGRENYGILKGLDAEAAAILWRELTLFFRNPKFRKAALTEPRKYRFRHFFKDAASLVANLAPEDVVPCDKVGIRPQLADLRTGELVMDFRVERAEKSVHVLNAISPAFTASMAFAEKLVEEYVVDSGVL